MVLPITLSWGWGWGFLYRNDFEDHGGAISIYFCAAVCALIANLMVGPRYGMFMSEEDKDLIKGGGKKFKRKQVVSLLEQQKMASREVDAVVLQEFRKLVRNELKAEDME